MTRTDILFLISILWLGMSCTSGGSEEKELPPSTLDYTSSFERESFRALKTERGVSIQDSFRESDLTELELPVQRIVLTSTTQLYYFQALGVLTHVVGCPWLSFVKDRKIQERIIRGVLSDVTQGAGLDLEKIMALRPDVLLYDPRRMDIIERLEDAGVLCIPFFEYQETDPMDRSAWLELVGMLTGKEEEAMLLTDSIKTNYEANKVMLKVQAPRVLFGSYFQGVWSAAGGGSLIARMIEDAGAEYVIEGEETAAVDLDLEEFIGLLATIDYIGMVQQGQLSRQEWLALEPRIEKSMIQDKVLFYTNTLESDYFGKGVLEPHIMLQELNSILSPEPRNGRYFQIAE